MLFIFSQDSLVYLPVPGMMPNIEQVLNACILKGGMNVKI